MPKKFSPELRDRAVRMVYDRHAREGGPRAASIRAVAPQLGVGEGDPADLVQPVRPHRTGLLGRAARGGEPPASAGTRRGETR